MHKTKLCLWSLILLAIISACKRSSGTEPPLDHAAKYGLNQSLTDSFQAERAIVYANAMLNRDISMRFVSTWETSELSPKFKFGKTDDGSVSVAYDQQNNICTYYNTQPIPVYLIDDENIGEYENIFVPDGEKCVFINVRSIRKLWDDFGMRAYEYPGGDISRLHSVSLSVMLLHEMGHLFYGDNGSYSPPASFALNELDSNSQLVNNKEIRADKFAVEQIIRGGKLGETDTFSLQALGTGNDFIAGDMLRTIKAAVSSYEIDKDVWGIFDGKTKPVLFSTKSYSHPNLFLRFQMMDYQLAPSTERFERLKEILGHS